MTNRWAIPGDIGQANLYSSGALLCTRGEILGVCKVVLVLDVKSYQCYCGFPPFVL